MTISETVRKVCSDLGYTLSELARRTNQAPSSLSRKLSKETISLKEFRRYMQALDTDFEIVVTYPNGIEVKQHDLENVTQGKLVVLEAQLEAERKNSEFLKNMIRDIRTELYSADGYTDMALKNTDNTEVMTNYLKKSSDAHAHMNAVLCGVLNDNASLPSEKAVVAANADHTPRYELLKNRRIIVAEDNDMNREITVEMLSGKGLIIEEAVNGKEVVEKIKTAAPGFYSMILMDIQMPEMDGFEATQAIRALTNRRRANIPIIAMTANGFAEDRQKSFDAGMDAHLAKPLDPEKLIETITALI